MRALLLALLTLAACATSPERLPTLRYADAASRGAFAALLAGRPNQDQVDRATDSWTAALRDSFGCDVSMRHVIDAGLVGALEIAAMNAAASGGGEREVREGVARYITQLISMATSRRERPSTERCNALAAWAPRTADAGRDIVSRARRNGLMDDEYGLLLELLGR